MTNRCGHPLILASPLDKFRMHYAGDFLRERAQAAEVRVVAAGLEDGVLFTGAAGLVWKGRVRTHSAGLLAARRR